VKKVLISLLLFFSTSSLASVDVVVTKKTQTMDVIVDGEHLYRWPVSTARKGHYTPTGTFHPYSMQLIHYSRKYDNAPMPYSIFFNGDYAIHGTSSVANLGRPASHGCVRLATNNAKTLYNLIKNYNSTIIIK